MKGISPHEAKGQSKIFEGGSTVGFICIQWKLRDLVTEDNGQEINGGSIFEF